MQPVAPEFLHVLLLPLAALSFLLPGWLLGRCLGTTFPALTTLLGSCAILFNSVLLLDAIRVPLNAGSIGLVLALWCVPTGGHLWRTRVSRAMPSRKIFPWPRGVDRWWLLPATIALVSVSARAIIDPLSGWDNRIRWDYLARLMLAQGSLEHYPPVSAEDFSFYSWCDGIPPLVPILNFWIYAVTGSIAPALTAVRVIGETLLIGAGVFKLSRRIWGETAGWPALAALASSSLVLWSCAMGQETGLLTVSLVALLLFLETFHAEPRRETAAWAGVAAGVGAISREYGLAFVLLGVIILFLRHTAANRWRAAFVFCLAAILTAGPWYGRNWILTGNPLFPHSLGGLFPTNPIHVEIMRAIAGYCNVWAGYFSFRELPVALAITAGALVGCGTAGFIRLGQRAALYASAVLLVMGLWWWALPFTAGGWTYAHRVLTPALAILSVFAGWLAFTGRAAKRVALIVLTLLSIDAGRRTWLLPQYPETPPLPYTFSPWLAWRNLSGGALVQFWPVLIEKANGQRVLVDHPSYHAELVLRGGQAVPWFSPLIRGMFDSSRSFEVIHRELLVQNIRFISLDRSNPMTAHFCRKYAFLGELTARYQPSMSANAIQVYDLNSLSPVQP